MKRIHSMPFGAELTETGQVCFRLWAPKAQTLELCLDYTKLECSKPDRPKRECFELSRLEGGWFELVTSAAAAGSHYSFQIDGKLKVPDPASRFQPSDVHGPSEVIDPRAFDWTDDDWRGRAWHEAVIYELHVGTFTPEGTFRAIEEKLDYLRDLGVTVLELMPVADFPGKRNWGYDGVMPFAPDSTYGRPEDLKHLVQAAHAKGLMIFLDVVYNHFGPDGNYLSVYSPQFFTSRHHTPWGDGINFDGPESRIVRDYFIHNALYWLEEYHFDGLRLDAVHAIADDSTPDILTELAQTVRQRVGDDRFVHLILENGDNAARYLRRDREGHIALYNAQWDDDIHHAVHVLITGECDGYYSDYVQQPMRHLCRCLTEGFAFQGEYSDFHHAPRGEPSKSLPPSAFVSFLQNHDQIGNRAFGDRITQLAPPNALKAAMEILLLAPAIPLLFMGEEFGAASPFLFFCDFHGELAAAVTNGRRNEFAHFAKFSSPEIREQIPNPNAEQTFLQSKLDWRRLSDGPHSAWLKLYRQLLEIRRQKIVPHLAAETKAHTECCSDQKRRLSINWAFADGALLQLRANLGDELCILSPIEGFNRIYVSNPETAEAFVRGQLPPWSVVWLLHEQV
jgi:maltooligosyltrehalose trehalohydrolase